MKRFWDKVDTSGVCWEWGAGINGGGYGQFRRNSRTVQAHRFVYSLVYGSVPDDMYVCHRCDNKICVKPSHLFLGTQRDNIKDSLTKGRMARGEANGKSKLTENDVCEIRRLQLLGLQQKLLAKMWRTSDPQISYVVNRVTWRHI